MFSVYKLINLIKIKFAESPVFYNRNVIHISIIIKYSLNWALKHLKYSKISNGYDKKINCIFLYSNFGHHIKWHTYVKGLVSTLWITCILKRTTGGVRGAKNLVTYLKKNSTLQKQNSQIFYNHGKPLQCTL